MTTGKLRPVRASAVLTHDLVRESLPWHVNGTLDPALRARIDAHLAECAECRAELLRERCVADAMRADPGVELGPQAGLSDVMARIDRRERRQRAWRPLAPFANPLPLAVALQALVIVALAAFIVFAPAREATPAYRALTTTPAVASGGPLLRVVFADELSLGELRALLAPLGARIVDGPRSAGIYTLQVDSGDSPEAIVASLRADQRVRLAEIADTP